MPRYSQIVQPPKLAVRRETGAAMIENAKLFDRLLIEKKLKPIDPDDPVPLYDVEEIRFAWLAYKAECRGL
jgi:hypothetical protein